MEDNKRCKFDFVAFLAVLIFIAFIGCMCVAIAFGIKQQKNLLNVAYADDELYGEIVYHSNLLPDYNYGFAATLTLDSSYPKQANILTNGATVYYSLQRAAYGYATISGLVTEGHTQFLAHKSSGATSTTQRPQLYVIFPVTVDVNTLYTYYCDVYEHDGNVSFGFCNYDFDNNTITASSATNVNTTSSAPSVIRTSSTEYSYFYILITTLGTVGSESYLTTNYMKLEEGVFYSGREPLSSGDIYDQGYQMGYNAGYVDADVITAQNYVHITDLDWSSFPPDNFITDFNFNGKQYRFDNYQSSQSLYLGNYNQVGFGYSTLSNTYVGLKFSSSNLYGDIMITMPWVDRGDKSLMLVFEVVETGELLTITNDDSLHWFYNSSSVGKWFIPSEYTSFYDVYNITVKVFFSSQVNIYFLPETDILGGYSTSEVNSRMAYLCYPYSAEYADIYSTQSSTALSSFDDGFSKGLERGRIEARGENTQAVANARAAGYEAGRRDALEDANDYSFMGLLGAVFDAPIKSFQGLLNFDVLGVNMQSFVLALLSLSVIIIIIKIALGGK